MVRLIAQHKLTRAQIAKVAGVSRKSVFNCCDQVERGGVDPHWRAIVDDKGRVKVAICFNMDLGDAWEWADLPEYPEKYSSMAFRMGVNYVIYAMTH